SDVVADGDADPTHSGLDRNRATGRLRDRTWTLDRAPPRRTEHAGAGARDGVPVQLQRGTRAEGNPNRAAAREVVLQDPRVSARDQLAAREDGRGAPRRDGSEHR